MPLPVSDAAILQTEVGDSPGREKADSVSVAQVPERLTDAAQAGSLGPCLLVALGHDIDEIGRHGPDMGEDFVDHYLIVRADVAQHVDERDAVEMAVRVVADRDERTFGKGLEPLRIADQEVYADVAEEGACKIGTLPLAIAVVKVVDLVDRCQVHQLFHKGSAPLATQLRDHFLDFLYGNDRHFISLPCAGASGRSGRSNGRP